MLVKNCIQLAATLLQLDICDSSIFSMDADERQIYDNKELMLFVKCANLVQSELAEQYFPLTTTETIQVKDSLIDYKQLTKSIVEVISITYKGGKINFKALASFVKLSINSGDVEITYHYRPESTKFNENMIFGTTKIDVRIIAYAIAAEYCLIKGNFEDASIWDSRYKSALQSISSINREIRVKRRGWY